MKRTINQYMKAVVGPYKGYSGVAEWDQELGEFHGRVSGLSDIISFRTKDFHRIGAEMAVSIDEYLKFCAAQGRTPDKPKSGKFMVRIPPELHDLIASISSARGTSINSIVEECLQTFAGTVGKPIKRSKRLRSSKAIRKAKAAG